MRTSPRSLRSSAGLLTAALAAVLSVLLVTGSFAPAQAAHGAATRTITATTNASAAPVNTAVVVSGTVSRAPRGSAVQVQRLVGRKWLAVRSTRTTGAGTYAARITLPPRAGTYSFRVALRAAGAPRSVVSRPVRIAALNAVTLELGALPALVAAGGRTTLFGAVQPYVAGTNVAIQRQVAPTRWSTVATVPLDARGEFSKGLQVTTAGTFRAVVGRAGLNAASLSRTVVVRTTPVIETSALPDGVVGSRYTLDLAAVGAPAGTWTASPLPPGLTLDPGTGRLSGTPSTDGETVVQVGFTQADTGFAAPSRSLTLRVGRPTPPTIATTELANGTVGIAYAAQLVADGDGVWTAAPLPAGLVLDQATGAISGKPTAVGDTAVTLGFTRTSTGLAAAPKTLTLHVDPTPKPVVATTALPQATRLSSYSATLRAEGDPAGSWTATPLPSGLVLNTATGVISGTPSAVGDTNVQVTFTQSDPAATSEPRTLVLRVVQAAAPVITTSSLPDGGQGKAYSTTLTAAGDPAGSWTATPLPNGLSLNGTTGVLSGTPTAGGATDVTLRFTEDRTGLSSTKTLRLTVNPRPVITTSSLPTGVTGIEYSTTLAADSTGGTWTASPLPAGLAVDGASGVISGTPTAVGSTNVVLSYTNTYGLTSSSSLTLTVNPRPVITTTTLDPAYSYSLSAYSEQIQVANGGPGNWSAVGLPSSFTINSSGVIQAPAFTRFTAGEYPVTVQYTRNSDGAKSAPVTLILKVS